MTISDYQINRVIKTYVKNMKGMLRLGEKAPEDGFLISEDGVKRMVFDRIEEIMTAKLRRHGSNE